MFFTVIFLALLTVALSAYFLPRNALSSGTTPEGAEAQVLQRKEGNEGGDAKTKIPISVNYHLTRQCNYSCGSSHSPSNPTPPALDLNTHPPPRFLLPHRKDISRRAPPQRQARHAPPQRSRHAQSQLRRRRALPAPQIPRPSSPILQSDPPSRIRLHRHKRQQGDGVLAGGVRPVHRHHGRLVRFL